MEDTIALYIKKCYDNNWITQKDGNISFKFNNQDQFYITPSNVKKNEIKSNDILTINLNNLSIIKNPSNLTPSEDLLFHQKIYNLYKHTHNNNLCIIHVHPPNILSYIGLLNINRELYTIKDIFPELNIKIGNNVDYYKPKTEILADKIYENIIGNDIIALKRHGIVAVGNNFEDIIEIIKTLEYYCGIFLNEK